MAMAWDPQWDHVPGSTVPSMGASLGQHRCLSTAASRVSRRGTVEGREGVPVALISPKPICRGKLSDHQLKLQGRIQRKTVDSMRGGTKSHPWR